MKTLVHLSDLHFGRVDAALLQPLVDSVRAAKPDLVVVSGDLTQRARTAQFQAAAAFLSELPTPQLVVPGNHDVPLYHVADRLLRPLAKYRRYIEPDLSPCHVDDEMAVLGLNTARSLVVKNGRINPAQLTAMREALCPLPEQLVKVVVTHHPFDATGDVAQHELIGRAELGMQAFADCGVDVLLSGHRHVSHSDDTGSRYALAGYGALAVAAGTATSTRGRSEANAFNVLQLDKHRVDVQRHEWSDAQRRFAPVGTARYVRAGRGWVAAPTH